MIEAIAKVTHSEKGWVTVEASQQSSCDACSQPECGSGQVNQALARRYHQLTLPYAEPLPKGAQVVIAIPEHGLLTAVGLMFVLPLLSLILAAAMGQWLVVSLLEQHELWVMFITLLGGFLGFAAAKRWHSRLTRQDGLEPKIVRLLSSGDAIKIQEISH